MKIKLRPQFNKFTDPDVDKRQASLNVCATKEIGSQHLPGGGAAASLQWKVYPWIQEAAGCGSSGLCLGSCKLPTASRPPRRAGWEEQQCTGLLLAVCSEPCCIECKTASWSGGCVQVELCQLVYWESRQLTQCFYRLPGLQAAGNLLFPEIN